MNPLRERCPGTRTHPFPAQVDAASVGAGLSALVCLAVFAAGSALLFATRRPEWSARHAWRPLCGIASASTDLAFAAATAGPVVYATIAILALRAQGSLVATIYFLKQSDTKAPPRSQLAGAVLSLFFTTDGVRVLDGGDECLDRFCCLPDGPTTGAFFLVKLVFLVTTGADGLAVVGVFSYEIAETKVTQVMDYAQQHQHPLQCTMEKE